jgi:hypothetical protein
MELDDFVAAAVPTVRRLASELSEGVRLSLGSIAAGRAR